MGERATLPKDGSAKSAVPYGIPYNRRVDDFRTDKVVTIFKKISSFPSDYENNKGGKLDWISNYSALVAPPRIELGLEV